MPFRVYPDTTVDPGNDRDHPLQVAANSSTGRKAIGSLPASGICFVRIAWIGGGPDPAITLAADTGDDTPIPMDRFVHPVFNLPGGLGSDIGDGQVLPTDAAGVYLLRIFLNAAATWTIGFTNNDTKAHSIVWVVADSEAEAQQ